jgi:hypothetical protein
VGEPPERSSRQAQQDRDHQRGNRKSPPSLDTAALALDGFQSLGQRMIGRSTSTQKLVF